MKTSTIIAAAALSLFAVAGVAQAETYDGVLQFNEYAASGIAKFATADADGDGRLNPAEYATTAPKPGNRQTASAEACRCPQT